jgi:hypothetical protein
MLQYNGTLLFAVAGRLFLVLLHEKCARE